MNTSLTRRPLPLWAAPILVLLLLAGGGARAQTTYHNPLPLRLADGSQPENCADPAVLRDPKAERPTWYLYCTTDPLSHKERDGDGWRFHLLPTYRSTDLVHWQFVRDAFETRPPVAASKAGLWAPEPEYFNGRYYLYFTVTDVADGASPAPGCDNDSGIAVATSSSPAGPWEAAPQPVIAPRRASQGCNFHWTFDPKVIATPEGSKYIYYGSYGGGVFVQRLSEDGLHTTGEPVRVGADDRYEGAEVVRHGGYYYLFASATDCCNGPLTGYALFVGRSERPEGPFLDRGGNDMAGARAGGTPFLAQNGNRWIGSGHNAVLEDAAGQWWTIYHAIDRNNPFFSVKDKLTRRLAMLDRVDWVDGWPVAAGGAGPSDASMPGPYAAPAKLPPVKVKVPPMPAATPLWTETFKASTLDKRWQWLRPRAQGSWRSGADGLVLPTQKADLYKDTNTASVLATALPAKGDYRIDLRVQLDAPDACCADPVQAGLVVFRDDDHYVKLVELARKGLRQVEFAKELVPREEGYPSYGNTVVGTPGAHTWLRLDVQRIAGEERYTAYSSQNGTDWERGGTWTHTLGAGARLGLVAMGGAGHQATFDRLSVSRLGK